MKELNLGGIEYNRMIHTFFFFIKVCQIYRLIKAVDHQKNVSEDSCHQSLNKNNHKFSNFD